MSGHTHVVVIAGGSGTRFWPLSRKARPKQLLPLLSSEALIASTFHRVAQLVPVQNWWMVVGAGYADACHAAVGEVPAAQVLVEPVGRNTAPAIGLAAVHLLAKDPDAVMVVLPADHYVRDTGAFNTALDKAAVLAARGPIVTLGIEPTHPEVGFGYIERGEPEANCEGAYRVRRFCEKPDLEEARRFLAAGTFFWNAGIFVMRAASVWAELERQLPRVAAGLGEIRAALDTDGYDEVLRRVFPRLESISIDYGVMEGAREVAVVPAACGWSDVGSFAALDTVLAKDEAGNVKVGRAVGIDSHDCVLYAEPGQVVAAVGLRNLAIVHTADATLVVSKERSQEVRAVLEALKENGWTEHL